MTTNKPTLMADQSMNNQNLPCLKKSITTNKKIAVNDPVNHPDHYTKGRQYETISVLEDWGLDRDYYLGNALKYISRAGRKGYFKEDIAKAIWYLQRRLQTLEKRPL